MSQHEPEASAAEQEAVRRLLARARHDEPVPPDVAARLDAVLAGLVAEGPRGIAPPPPPPGPPPPSAPPAPLTDLAARRRRRRVTGLLGAAAAVVVLGVGVGQVIDTGDSGDESGSSEVSGDEPGGAAEDHATRDDALPEAEPPESSAPSGAGQPPDVPSVGARTFSDDAVRLRDLDGIPSTTSLRLSGADLTSSPMFECPLTSWGEGRLLAVRFGDLPAVLAYRPPAGDTQTVELLQCGSGEVLRSTVIAFP